MKISINWGTGIAIFIGIFMISMLMMVFSTLNHRWDLVADDYYEQDLKFDQKAEKMRNAATSGASLSVSANHLHEVAVAFSGISANTTGTLRFFRPSDAALDFAVPFAVGQDLRQSVKSAKLVSGKWKAIAEWKGNNGKDFYIETTFLVP